MSTTIKSIRPFIGAKNYETSRSFYKALGFTETVLFHNMCVCTWEGFAFYLQDAYVKDWIDNTMIFMEVADVESFYQYLNALQLPEQFEGVSLTPIQYNDWGNECFLNDPSGVLWHFGEFAR